MLLYAVNAQLQADIEQLQGDNKQLRQQLWVASRMSQTLAGNTADSSSSQSQVIDVQAQTTEINVFGSPAMVMDTI